MVPDCCLSSALAIPSDLGARRPCRGLRGWGCAHCQSLPRGELFPRERKRPRLYSQAGASPPRLCAARRAHTHLSFYLSISIYLSGGFPGGLDGKESACIMGDQGSIPGSGRSLEKANGYPFQYSSLGNCMDAGAWQATVLRVTKSQM